MCIREIEKIIDEIDLYALLIKFTDDRDKYGELFILPDDEESEEIDDR